ncbi:MAG: choice-of-anchor J domain-containing protein, partial [Bacteroidales bacterium]|nr:choice-of-anchor J domain-containing protein [Bacteroidales bacterium]
MKKKVFSLMMMLLLAFMGVAKAEVVTIGDGTSTTYVTPFNSLWGYSFVEQIFTADEIGTAGTISAISFNLRESDAAQTNSVDVFMKAVTRSSFSSTTDYEAVTANDMVFSGTVTFSPGWTTITLDTPFEYDGTSNLLIGMHEYTSGYSTLYFYYTSAADKVITFHSDSANPDPYNLGSYSGNKYTSANRANIQITIAGEGGGSMEDMLHVKYMDGENEVIDTLNMGVRPAGAWMEPFNFTMYSEGPNYTVNVLDFTPSDGMFSVEGEELPFQVRNGQDVELTLTCNGTEAGAIERQFVAITEGNRAAHIWPVMVELYTPVCPDVWELACEEATEFPFVEVPQTAHNMQLHNDYTLPFPEIPEGYDAVYKLEFANDMVLNAEVTQGENGKVALYTEDFYGEGGPMATNNYNGPLSGAGGASATPFEAQIGEGTSTTGYFPFYTLYNYTISENLFLATELAEAGVTTAPMTSLSWYATNAPGYAQQGITIWMANVEDAALTTTSHIVTNMTKVYTGAMTPAIGWNEFVFNEGTFSWDGHSNVLIFCQRNNGDWNSTVNWQATTSLPFNAMAYRYQDSGAYDPTVANPMYTSTTRPNIIMKGGNRDRAGRDVVTIGDQTGSSYYYYPANMYFNYSFGEQIYTADEIGMAGTINSISFYYNYTSSFSMNNLTLFMKHTDKEEFAGTTDMEAMSLSDIVWSGNMSASAAGWVTITLDTPFQYDGTSNLMVGMFDGTSGYPGSSFKFYTHTTTGYKGLTWYSDSSTPDPYTASSWSGSTYRTSFVNDIQLDITAGGAAGEFSYGPVITDAPVAAGTYYLVASSTDADLEVTINAEEMPCPDLEGFAFNPIPADDEDELEPASVTLKWNNPANATEYQVVFGSTYYPEPNHPQTIISDWTPVNGATGSFTVRNLWNNTNYFWYVVFRNGGACTEGVESPHWGFTTHLNIPQNLTAVDETVFNDEQIVLNWNAVVDRTYRMYNVYRDGELIGHTDVNNISNTTYTDGPLEYNMEGYTYYVTAVYDEGESAPSNTVNVKVSGYGDVNGHVYEQDGTTGIAGATVTMVGQDEFGVSHTYNFQTNTQGYYTGHIYAGAAYDGQAAKDGYQTATAPVQGEPIVIVYDETTSPIDYILDENFDPVCTVIAEYYPDSLDPESPYVKVYWGCGLPGEEIIEPFETGDFSLFDWQIDPTYPWSITTNQPYEGTYCMKSGGAGVASVTSNMTVTVNIPADGIMSFFGKISSEANWDYGYFYIDGVQKGSYTGAGSWGEKKFDITAGDHTFRWQYTKDGSVNSNDDCFYVDYITFYKRPEPAQPGWHTYCESEFNNAVGSNLTTTPSWAYEYPASFLHNTYAGWNITKVSLFSDNMYNAVGGNYTCRIYVGGNEPAAGTMVSTITVDVPSGQNAWVDWDLTTPVNVTGTDPIWVVWTANSTVSSWPAGCCGDLNDLGTWWDGGQGWEHLTYGTWTMRHWFTNRAGRSVAVEAADVAPTAVVDANPINSNLRTSFPKGGDTDKETVCANPNAVKGAALSNDANRSLNHYRVYRTNCYQECPFTEENTVLLATVWVPDTVYIDVEWADLEPGVYKWGVGAVYEGNRGEMIEAPINWAAPVTITRDATADNDPNPVTGEEGNRAPWDLMTSFSCTSGYQYGVATDGNYIYTCSWSSSSTSQFYKYDMNGNFVEEFNVSGSGQIRDLTYDGQYFYGVANSTTVYCLDLANHALVNTFTSGFGAAQRGITYDPQRDGFWVIGNWSGNLTLINRQGAVQFTGPAPTSASGLAYYKDDDNVEHVFCFNNGDNGVYDYNITTNTMGGSVFNFSSTPGYASGSSGGCHVAEYNGKVAFFGDLQQSPNVIGIYELKDAAVGPTPGPGGDACNQLALPRESETIWSNCLDKDMFIINDSLNNNGVTVNVLLNSADSPEGVQVTFTNYNEAEQEMYPVDPIELDETGFYAFQSFRKGEYNVKVEFDGYEPIEDSVSIWEPTDLRYVMTEIIYGVSDLYVSSTGWAMWGAEGTPGGGGGQGGQVSTFSVDLEGNSLPEGWTVIDGNNDGWTWCLTSAIPTTWTYYASLTLDWYHSGTNAICSGSYINGVGALNPDEYLVTPQVTLGAGSTFSFWAAATDASYAADHFGVFVSDDMTNWTSVQEWTLTAKNAAKSGDLRASRDGNGNRLGNWYNYSVDLSAYAGQKYIAIRHFNCYDQYIMCVDDIELTDGAKDGDRHLEYFKVMCTSIDGEPIFNADTEHPFCQVNTESLVAGDHYIAKVAAVYSTGMSAWSECEWQYIPCDNYAGTVNGVEVNGNEISWEYPGGGPGPQPGPGDAFSVDFEAGLPAGWNVIDANNDGWTWCLTSNIPSTWTYYASLSLDWYRSGTNAICSGSYINGVGALNPDEYLVTPQVNIANGSTFSFWAAATDASYAADHFGVFVSDNGTSDWTMVNEWTLTAKNGVKAGDLRASRDGNGTRLGNWYNYNVDLSAFAGQKYIAIRHFGCTDQYIMCVDDIELTNGAKSRDTEVFFNGFVTDPGAMANGADASWIKNGQATWGPNVNNGGGYMLADQFTLSAATTISEIEVYGYQTGSSTTSTFTGLYAQIYNGSPMSGGTAVWGSMTDNIMTATAFTNCYRGSDGETNATTRPIMSITAGNLNIDLEAGTYYLVYSLTGSGSSGPWGAPHCEPAIGNTGNGLQYTSSGWGTLLDSGSNTPYGCAMKIMGAGGTPGPGPQPGGDVLGAMIFVDGEWEAFVEAPTNTYTYEGEGNEICVRMVYNGTNDLPEGNIYYSMSCPECEEINPEGCAPGEPIHAEVNNATDEVTVWWGEQPTPPAQPIEEWLYYDDGANVDAIGLTTGGSFYWGI